MLRIRRYIKVQDKDNMQKIDKLEKLMLRISAFSVMYIVPTVVLAACIGYQSFMLPHWLANWYQHRCERTQDRTIFGFGQSLAECPEKIPVAPPELLVFVFRYVSQLIVGITCAVWIFSGKTVTSWYNCYARNVYRRSPVPTQPPPTWKWFSKLFPVLNDKWLFLTIYFALCRLWRFCVLYICDYQKFSSFTGPRPSFLPCFWAYVGFGLLPLHSPHPVQLQ